MRSHSALRVAMMLGGSLGIGSALDVMPARRESYPPFVPQPRFRRQKDRPRVVRIAGPGGFRWHVKLDGLTISSHATPAAAEAACAIEAKK